MSSADESFSEYQERTRRERRRRANRKGLGMGLLAIAAVAAILLWIDYDGKRDDERRAAAVVERYCRYSPASEVEIRRCLRTTTARKVSRLYNRADEAAIHAIESVAYTDYLEQESQESSRPGP